MNSNLKGRFLGMSSKQQQKNVEDIYHKSTYILDDEKAVKRIGFIGNNAEKVSFDLIFQQAKRYSDSGLNVLLIDFMGIANRKKRHNKSNDKSSEVSKEEKYNGQLEIISDKYLTFKNNKVFDIHYSYLETGFDIILYQLPPAQSYDKKIIYTLKRVDLTIIEVVKNVTLEEELITLHRMVATNTNQPIKAVMRTTKWRY